MDQTGARILASALALSACQNGATTVTACELVRDPAPHLDRMIAVEDVALASPRGTIAITAVRGCPIEAVQGIELELGEAETDNIAALRRNLDQGRRASRPGDVRGVAARFVGRVEQDFDGSLTLYLSRAEDQRIARADDMLQPGLYDAMEAGAPASDDAAR